MSKRKGQTNGNKARVAERVGSAGNTVPDGLDAAGAHDAGVQATGTPPPSDGTDTNAAPVVAGSDGIDGAAGGQGVIDGSENSSSGSGTSEDSGDAGNNVPGDIDTRSSSGSIENDGDASADGAADDGKNCSVSRESGDQAGSVGGGDTASGNDGREDGEGGTGAQSRLQRRNGRLYLRHADESGALSADSVGHDLDDLKAAIELAGCDTAENLIDMARIGSNVMEAIDDIRKLDGPFKDWAPMDDPAEIVHDLYNALEYAREKAAAAPAADAPPEADSCPVCDVPFKPDDLCAIDIEMGTCHAECLDGTPVVDLNTGEPSDGPVLTFRYGDEKSELAGAPPLESDALTDAIHDASIFAGAYTPENFPASQNDPEFWRKCNPDDIIMNVADDAFRSVHANIEVIGAILTGGVPLEGSAFSYEAAKDLQDFIRKIGRRATPEILAQQLVITKHRQSAELTSAEHIGLKTFIAVLIDLDDFAAAEKKRLEDLAAEKPEPRPVPIEDTTMETVDDPMATH